MEFIAVPLWIIILFLHWCRIPMQNVFKYTWSVIKFQLLKFTSIIKQKTAGMIILDWRTSLSCFSPMSYSCKHEKCLDIARRISNKSYTFKKNCKKKFNYKLFIFLNLFYFWCSFLVTLYNFCCKKCIHSTHGKELRSWSPRPHRELSSFWMLVGMCSLFLFALTFSLNHRLTERSSISIPLRCGQGHPPLGMSWSGKHTELSFFPCNSQLGRFLPHMGSAVLSLTKNLFF